jgi:hypothetical protein
MTYSLEVERVLERQHKCKRSMTAYFLVEKGRWHQAAGAKEEDNVLPGSEDEAQ